MLRNAEGLEPTRFNNNNNKARNGLVKKDKEFLNIRLKIINLFHIHQPSAAITYRCESAEFSVTIYNLEYASHKHMWCNHLFSNILAHNIFCCKDFN